MSTPILRTALASAAVGVLSLAAVALGAPPVSATDPANLCGNSTTSGTEVDITTDGTHWYEVCVNDPTFEDAYSDGKQDSFDGFGELYFDYDGPDEVDIGAPDAAASYSQVGATWIFELVDEGVDVGGGDLVDVYVTRTFSGSFVRYEVEVLDSDDETPRNDVSLTLISDLGSDAQSTFGGGAGYASSYGDDDDPLILYSVAGGMGGWTATNGDAEVRLDFDGFVDYTVGLVDYGCANYAEALEYVDEIGPAFTESFGDVLAVPGAGPCVWAPDLTFTTGEEFDQEIDFTFAPEMDFTFGGYGNVEDEPPFLEVDWFDFGVDGTPPGLRIFGTAPAEPGTFDMRIFVGDNMDDNTFSYTFVTIVVAEAPPAEPILPATGADAAGTSIAIALLFGGGIALAYARRLRRT